MEDNAWILFITGTQSCVTDLFYLTEEGDDWRQDLFIYLFIAVEYTQIEVQDGLLIFLYISVSVQCMFSEISLRIR